MTMTMTTKKDFVMTPTQLTISPIPSLIKYDSNRLLAGIGIGRWRKHLNPCLYKTENPPFALLQYFRFCASVNVLTPQLSSTPPLGTFELQAEAERCGDVMKSVVNGFPFRYGSFAYRLWDFERNMTLAWSPHIHIINLRTHDGTRMTTTNPGILSSVCHEYSYVIVTLTRFCEIVDNIYFRWIDWCVCLRFDFLTLTSASCYLRTLQMENVMMMMMIYDDDDD